MNELQRAILLKSSMEPSIYAISTSVFPFETRGMFRSKNVPLPPARYAGYKQEVVVKPTQTIDSRFGLSNGCFETAPSTIFPCWESGFGCQTPYCSRTCESNACRYRAGMR